jgi:hypothetical protein
MTPFPGSPRLIKGALLTLKPSGNEVANTIAFQYNPETMTRTLQAKIVENNEGGQAETMLLRGAPIETIKFDAEIDATDDLEQGQKTASELGIYPELSALETLIYPVSRQVEESMNKAKQGVLEIQFFEIPMTLFVWGKNRVLPVRLKDFNITEEAYDINLNPIRAKVSLTLQVLSYDDLPWDGRGAKLFLSHQKSKEVMAKIGSIAGNGSAITGVKI